MVLTGMRFLEIPIHQMSVTGLIIALGLLIDNAIVIVDEVRSRIWDGLSRSQAIRDAVRHLAMPLFGSTLMIVAGFTRPEFKVGVEVTADDFHFTDAISDEAVAMVRRTEEPFFLYLAQRGADFLIAVKHGRRKGFRLIRDRLLAQFEIDHG